MGQGSFVFGLQGLFEDGIVSKVVSILWGMVEVPVTTGIRGVVVG